MRFAVLTSKPDSPYADTAESYEYPARYRQFFEPLRLGEPILAIIYEPLAAGHGRRAYVGWTTISRPPERSNNTTERGERLWLVQYDRRVEEFPVPVPRDVGGEPIEDWLSRVPAADRNLRTSGASVRYIGHDEARRIMELGNAVSLEPTAYPTRDDHALTRVAIADRGRRLVAAADRDARFRRIVIEAYEFQCAITGFGTGRLPAGRATALIDAAHVRPVAHDGADALANGIALTPTLHRMFDSGLFTIVRRQVGLEVVVSPWLESRMIESPDGSSRLELHDGRRLTSVPPQSLWPSDETLRFHQRRVFRGPESSVDG